MKRLVPFCLASVVWVAGCSAAPSVDDSAAAPIDPGGGDQVVSGATLAYEPLEPPTFPVVTFDPSTIQPIPGATDPLPAEPPTEPPPAEPPTSEPPTSETPTIVESPEQPPLVPETSTVPEEPPLVPETTIVPELPPPVVPFTGTRLVDGNPTCEEMFPGTVSYKLEDGSLKDGTHSVGSLTVTIDVDGDSVSFTSNLGLVGVIVKGGTAANVYALDGTSGTDLTTPYGSAVSHVTFCLLPP